MWAVIDIGSNTIRLVIYTIDNGHPRPMLNKKYAVGLAAYIDKANCIKQEGINILPDVLADINTILRYIHPECVLPFGTAALRNSANGDEIVSLIKERCGMAVRILSGEEEAVFDYYGAMLEGIGDDGLLVDVGGGSTELTLFKDRKIISALSIPLGSLNLYRTHVDGILPTQKEAHKIKKTINDYLDKLADNELMHNNTIYCVGGTARAALKIMRDRYLPSGREGDNSYTRSQLKGMLDDIEKNRKQLMHNILCLSPDRIHTLIPGLLAFYTVAKHYDSNKLVTISLGVREGYLMHHLGERGNTRE